MVHSQQIAMSLFDHDSQISTWAMHGWVLHFLMELLLWWGRVMGDHTSQSQVLALHTGAVREAKSSLLRVAALGCECF